MTKLPVVLALTATVTAHRRNHHMKQYFGISPVVDQMIEEVPTLWDFVTPIEEPTYCPKAGEGDVNMSSWEFHLKLNQTVWNKFVKGMYHTQSHWPVSKECFGDDMIESAEAFTSIYEKVKGLDIFNITENEILVAMRSVLDVLVHEKNDCSLTKPLYDSLDWCITKPEVCMWGQGTMTRVWDNRLSLFNSTMNLVNLLWPRDESCMKDSEIIESMGAVTENITEMCSTTFGFEGYTWDQSQKVAEEPLDKKFKQLYKQTVKSFPSDLIPEIFRTVQKACPLEMAITQLPTLSATQLPKLNLHGDILIDKVPLNFFIDRKNVPEAPKSFGFGLF